MFRITCLTSIHFDGIPSQIENDGGYFSASGSKQSNILHNEHTCSIIHGWANTYNQYSAQRARRQEIPSI